MECPCEICIVRIFCRQKTFSEFRFCIEVSNYLGVKGNWNRDQKFPIDKKLHMKNFPKFYKVLKPLYWKYKKWPIDHPRSKKDYMIQQLR
jgi:hypothetical protein